MDVVGEGRNPASSGTGKRESGAGSEPGGSDKESDNDEKVCQSGLALNLLTIHFMSLYVGNYSLIFTLLMQETHQINCDLR